MLNYKLSHSAAKDIMEIGHYGMVTFGLEQAMKYQAGLESRFELLAQFPRIGVPTYDLNPGLYRYTYQSHTLFYTIGVNDILIVRVIHGAADFKRYF